jgi:nicotinamide phosphoribosyltransferase
MEDNIVLLTDSYKFSQWPQYPPKTTKIFSYLASRGGQFETVTPMGYMYGIKKRFVGNVVTKEKIDEAYEICKLHFGNDKIFNLKGWTDLLNKHNGKLPIEIKALPEGTTVPTQVAFLTIENTDPEFYWLTNYLETLIVQSWYPTTVCTISREIKKVIKSMLMANGDPSLVDFKLHDFGFRGVSSVESAAIGGLAHLVNFKGTDTMSAIMLGREYYHEPMAGFSIPASEHSTITSWMKPHEVDAYRNMLEQFPTGLVACVSDSYDIYNACENLWGDSLKNEVLNREGTLVVRPDSGYPPEVVLKVLFILGEKFGYETNQKGFKVLNPHVRVIQGDGVNYAMIKQILTAMHQHGWSADNITFGMGGALLQQLNRDTQRFAMKCSYAEVDGEPRDVFKQPVTDSTKNSMYGRLKTIKVDDTYRSIPETASLEPNLLETVFKNGEVIKDWSLDEIRKNADIIFK